MFLVRKKRRAWNFPERPVVRAPLFHYSISTRWRSRRTCAHLLLQELQNYNSLLNNRWQDNVGSHQKEIIPHIQGQRRSPSKMAGGATLHLETNPIPIRDAPRAQTKPCVHQQPPQRLSQTCLWVFKCLLRKYRSAVACCRGRGSGCNRLGYAISPLGGGHR